ncbi:MAG: hypothetical protein HY231_24025 [Acidobacteria bacterium]|nr:hypothetical protein [Acidobacteriota bacterium]
MSPIKLIARRIQGVERFICCCTFAEKEIPKRAGFQFNYKAPLPQDRYWFTEDILIAARLRHYAEGELRERLMQIVARPKQPTVLKCQGDGFVFLSEKEHKALAKDAGFTWDHKAGHWWTTDAERASLLVQYANASCGEYLQRVRREMEEAKAASRAIDAAIAIPRPANLRDDYLPYQRAGVAFGLKCFENSRGVLLADEMGLGKAQPLYSKLLTPSGWVTMNDIQKGDSVIGVDGLPTKVVGVYPQGEQDVYEFTFSDGVKSHATLEHLWEVEIRRRRPIENKIAVLTTKEILNKGLKESDGKYRFTIPIANPIQFEKAELPLDPYLLGVLIGDGSTTGDNVIFATTDQEILDNVSKVLPNGLRVRQVADYAYMISQPGHTWNRNKIKVAYRNLGLYKLRAWEKFIPNIYLFASVEQRIALLQGLMDTDGTAAKGKNGAVFYTSSNRLAEDVSHLIRSLGGIAGICSYQSKFKGKNYRITYAVSVGLSDPSWVFRLSRKRANLSPRTNKPIKRKITNISYAGKCQTKCIAIDSIKKLYVTDDFVVTHNTIQAIGIMNMISSMKKILILCPASLKLVWYRELNKWLVIRRRILIADSRTSVWKFQAADIVIANYDILPKHLDWHKESKREGQKKQSMVVDGLGSLGFEWDAVFADESHMILNRDSQRGACAQALLRAARRKGAITGTPLLNRVEEVFDLLQTLDPLTWDSRLKFTQRYCAISYTQRERRLAELQDKLRATIMCRRLKSEVLTELPPKRRQIIEFALDDSRASSILRAEINAWNERERELEKLKAAVQQAKAGDNDAEYKVAVASLKKGMSAAFEEMAKLRHDTAIAKVPYVINHIRSLVEDDSTYKVVVMAWHTEVIKQIAAPFGNRAVIVTGEVSANLKTINGLETSDRQQAVDRFQTDPSCQVFVGNIRAAGVGLTLTASSHIVFAELDWTPANLAQAEDRVHRIGQRDSVLVQHLVLEGSLDAKMAVTLVEKLEIIDRALNQGADGDKTKLNTLDKEQYEQLSELTTPTQHEAVGLFDFT